MDKQLEYDWNRHVGAANFGLGNGKKSLICPVEMILKFDKAVRTEQVEAGLNESQIASAHSQLDILGVPFLCGPKNKLTLSGRLEVLCRVLRETSDDLRKQYDEALTKFKQENPNYNQPV